MKNLADEIITLTDASKLSGFSKTYISRMIDSGHVQKQVPGKFKLGSFFLGVVTFLQAQRKDASTKSPNYERILKAKAEALELKNRVTCRELVSLDDSLLLINTVFVPLKTAMLGIGARVTRDPQLRAVIDNYVNDILQAAADRSAKMEKVLKSDTPSSEPDPDVEFEGG